MVGRWLVIPSSLERPVPPPAQPPAQPVRARGLARPRRGVGHPRHPGRGDARRRQVAAAGHRRREADRRGNRRAGGLGRAPGFAAAPGGGGLRRSGLAGGARPQPFGAGRRQLARPEPGLGRLRHHLPGGGRRPRPAPRRDAPPPHPPRRRRGPPSAGAGRRRGGGRGRTHRGCGLEPGAAAAVSRRASAAPPLRHPGAGRRPAHPVAALPHRERRADTGHRRAGLGGDRLFPRRGARREGGAAGQFRGARR